MQKNYEYPGVVTSLGSDGEGVVKTDEGTAFVPFCLSGEKVVFKALKVKGDVAYGKLTEVHSLSPNRVAPLCPVFEKCGGCQLQHMNYQAQLAFKRQTVENCLKKIGGITAKVNGTVPSDKQFNYRNKLVLPVGTDGVNPIVGFFAPRSHRIVPIKECALQQEWNRDIISALLEFMRDNGLSGYDDDKRKGDVRHLVCREIKGKFIVTVVVTRVINLTPFARKLENIFKKFTLLLNVNKGVNNTIFGKDWRVCAGDGFFEGEDEGVKFKAGANTFLQVNDDVRSKLYEDVVKNIADKNAVAIDLYSGGGMLTAMLAKSCKAAYGIEIVQEAVACADELKEMNGLQDKMYNICGAVEDKLGGVFDLTEGAERVIVCDPPRKGMERSVVNAVLHSGADKVVLVSCNPATLARDLGLLCGTLKEADGQLVKNPDVQLGNNDVQLTEAVVQATDADIQQQDVGGQFGKAVVQPTAADVQLQDVGGGYYTITSITPYDMFPQTKHCEVVVVLRRKYN
jgi:23S rRNA (uracil1939-C5)-methyltransferase